MLQATLLVPMSISKKGVFLTQTQTLSSAGKIGKGYTLAEKLLILSGKTSVPLEVARKRAVSLRLLSDTTLSGTRHFPYSRTFFPKVGQALGITVLSFKLRLSG